MSKIVIVSILLTLLATPIASAGNPHISNFAAKLKSAILAGDRESLKNFACLPIPDQCFDEYIASYLFGSGEGEGEISKVLRNQNIQTKIFGPYTHEDRYKDSSYAIVFYDSSISFFLENGFMRPELVENEWNKGYVETVVTELGGEVYLHRTMFYYGAHLPWVDDY